MCEGRTNEKAWIQLRFSIISYTLGFATLGLTVRVPILKRSTQGGLPDLLCGRATTRLEEGRIDRMVRTNPVNPLLINARVGKCPSPEENILQYFIPVCASKEGGRRVYQAFWIRHRCIPMPNGWLQRELVLKREPHIVGDQRGNDGN